MARFRPVDWVSALGIAVAIHVDWHLARHSHGRLSFGWAWHWVLAIPVFALMTWALTRKSLDHAVVRAVVAILLGVLLGQIAEPLWEGGGAIRDAERWRAFGGSMAAGLVTWQVTYRLLRRDETTTSWGER
jgi:hypothetical protein